MGYFLGEMDGTRSLQDSLQRHQTMWSSVHRITLTFYVCSDTLNQTEEALKSSTPELPKIYETYPAAGGPFGTMTCINVEGREQSRTVHPETGAPCALWLFICEFSDEVDPHQQNIPDLPPNEKYAEWSWDSEEIQVVTNLLEIPINMPDGSQSYTLVTKAGEPIFYERKVPCAILHVSQYEATPFDYTIIPQFTNAINSQVFLDAALGSVKCKRIVAVEETINGIIYAKVEYVLSFRLEYDEQGEQFINTWVERVLNAGHFYLDKDTNAVKLFKLHGDPATVNLDDEGHALGKDQVGEETYITIPPKRRDFNLLLNRFRLP